MNLLILSSWISTCCVPDPVLGRCLRSTPTTSPCKPQWRGTDPQLQKERNDSRDVVEMGAAYRGVVSPLLGGAAVPTGCFSWVWKDERWGRGRVVQSESLWGDVQGMGLGRAPEMPAQGLGFFPERREVTWSGLVGSGLKGCDQCQEHLRRPPPSCRA